MSKTRVAVVVDSTACVPADIARRHNLHVIPQVLNWEGRSLLDGMDISPSDFYERLRTARTMPTTSQPSVGSFVNFFSRVAETAESIVAVLISEQLSGTLASARAAAQALPGNPIEIIDSRSTSMGLGFMALAAAHAAAQGLSQAEVAAAARALIPGMRVLFVVDTLEFLHRGGRIGGARRLVGSMLSIKPVLHLQDGRIEPLESVRTKRKAIERLLATAEAETQGRSPRYVAVIDAAASETEALCDAVTTRLMPQELVKAQISPVVGAHTGPGTIGLAYFAG